MGHRWRGYEHPELYNMINKGPGAAASEPQATYWQNLATELSDVDDALNGKLNSLGSRWEGRAAESATTGLTPLAEWASDAQTGSNVMKISAEMQGDHIADARHRMPEPVPVTTPAPSGWQIAGATGLALLGNSGPAVAVAAQALDHEQQEAAQNEAEQRAVETMRTYESSSVSNRNTLGTFVAPPDVVVETPPPAGGTATAVLYTPSRAKNVGTNNGSGGNGPGSGNPGGGGRGEQVATVQPPSGGGGGGGGGGTGGGGGGGGVALPPPTTQPGTTTPADVLLPTPPAQGPGPLPPAPGPGPLPPSPGPGPSPFPPGGGPLPAFGDGPGNNASDVARRPLPLRPGMPLPGMPGLPVEGSPFGGRPGAPGGPGGLPGGFGGGPFGVPDGERVPSQLGRGGTIGGVPGEGGVVRNGPGAAGAAGASGRGANGVHGPAGAAGRRAEDEEDQEHYAPDYLLETDDVFGDERRVSPTVIGE